MDIRVKVKTRSRSSAVLFDQTENLYYISVMAIPKDGEANAKIIKLLAKHFGISKSLISIKSGSGSSIKTITLSK